ncbi:PREDICTED: sentrin-specific protease 8-like [Amphimedon queenslandica]|uniref:Ubiquitin-like protease family profile domain-containing protein n=1 Tax=Amphimedon queenslandica TaxID=400682 RepID=A0A1X7VIZ0_AMPQE|nr:PREDICTED: sentrin-specific protease 8-like [Amphimedon queenslandica]|eukprot:XP_003383983.1 PREDICTED: sentrin-specific protease 8-like [Amphimedon queenslandica]
MDPDKIVLSYHDSLLRLSDVSLLDPPHWLNDRLIGFYFEYLERDHVKNGERVCFITPDVTQFIKLYRGSELKMFLEPLSLCEKELVILAVNDNSSSEHSGGSHWSTLVFDRESYLYFHYDSSSPSNHTPARQCASSLSPFLSRGEKEIPFLEEASPHQHNSHDCGVYALLFAKYSSLSKFKKIDPMSVTEYATLERVNRWRSDTKKLIFSLANDSTAD